VEPAGVSVIAYAPDGKTLAAATLNTATVWTTDGWHQSFTFTHTNRIRSLVYNRTGSRLLSGSLDGTAQLWSVRTRRLVEELRGHFGPVSQAALSADGRWAVTAGPLTAGVWPTQPDPRLPDNRLFFLRGNTMQVLSVAFSPAGWRIATGDADGSIRVYDCQVCGGLKELERIARARLAALHR
jgi:WD40 repeat protein